MTSGWCGKIANTFYDIFNGWSVDQLTKSYSKSINGINNNNNNNNNNRNDTDNNNNINNNINDRNNYLNRKPLERSESLWSWAGTGFNNYGYTRECRQQFSSQIESACTCHDTLFICDHQRNQLGISTTSNTSLNIPYYRCPPLGFQQPCQQQQQQQQQYRNQVLAPALNRSYSLDLPPSSYNNYNNNNNNNTFYQPFPNIIPINSQQPSTDLNDQRLPTMGITRQINKPIYSSNEQQQQQRDSITKNTNNPKLCQKLSARSSCSIPGDYDNTSEQQIQNNEEIIRSTVKNLVSRSSPYPMIYIPLGNTDYRVEGGYSNDSSLWSIVNTVSSADCQIDCDNISQIYNNDFYEQV
ncbi:unnamed protein product [Didymodactylos carnosus]|uniref:Uncharacterized protein n=1 Tax=Didymodactylos carnosus TaxID=1234261 RepID=A0A8S2ICL1_9BILA|nr:unnamed protein product [Didymodactylos carnosus]CAF3714084.1 unnamed protein product [Didymodactylos carnosus]